MVVNEQINAEWLICELENHAHWNCTSKLCQNNLTIIVLCIILLQCVSALIMNSIVIR